MRAGGPPPARAVRRVKLRRTSARPAAHGLALARGRRSRGRWHTRQVGGRGGPQALAHCVTVSRRAEPNATTARWQQQQQQQQQQNPLEVVMRLSAAEAAAHPWAPRSWNADGRYVSPACATRHGLGADGPRGGRVLRFNFFFFGARADPNREGGGASQGGGGGGTNRLAPVPFFFWSTRPS